MLKTVNPSEDQRQSYVEVLEALRREIAYRDGTCCVAQ